ncbi:MAG TPA: chloride channel protein [Acidimicrobiia bacterium]|nr:chloride channel protein [Acidimicrobiia bacterium]
MIERFLIQVRQRADTGFLVISLLVGVVVGIAAAALIWVLEAVEQIFHFVGDFAGEGAEWIVLVSVPLGLFGAWWLARRFAQEVAGDGVPEVSAALAVNAGYMATKTIPLKIIATALTLGGGGSAGREGPMVQIGGAIGSSVARRFGLGEDYVRSLVAAGAAAAIGASFNAPIAGMLFGLEVVLGSFAVRHMSAVVLSSIAAAVMFRSLVPESEILQGATYSLGGPAELVLYAGLAVLAVGAAYLFLRLLDRVEGLSHSRAQPAWLRPIGLGLTVGLIGIFEPRVLGTGQEFVGELLELQAFGEGLGVDTIAVSVLAMLCLGKIVATSLTIAAGGSGGAFMPSLFIGATLGAGYASFVSRFWTATTIRPGAFAVVGMATVFAAVARAPLTAIIIVFEVTGARDYELILPLMLSATFATFVADRVHPESVYTMPLARRGIRFRPSGEVDLLDTVTVGDVAVMPPVIAAPAMSLTEVSRLMDAHRYHGLPVVDPDHGLVGIITVTDVQHAGGPSLDLTVADAMTRSPVTVGPMTPVSQALVRLAVLGVGRLPVVSEGDSGDLVGLFRREDAVRAYHQALGTETDHALERDRLRQRVDPRAGYYDFRVPPGSMADGSAVRDVRWPEGSTLVSVRRGTEVLVPGGATVLAANDVVTAFGSESSRERMIERLNAGADEPTAEILVLPPDEPEAPDQR